MRYLSLFSGIEAASVAWEPLGWKAAAFCEIEPFPSAVLAHRFPSVPNLGDVTKANFDAVGPVDLIVFGSPCQSFSVAGKRLGLDDPRGNLALYALGVVKRLRPSWFLFENVPGLLSSGGGRDFAAFLRLVGECGYQCAWRVLDAQYAGVPQRRRRVFVVGYSGDWRRAAAVLFERHGLQGHTAPRRETGKDVAPTISARPTGGGRLGTDFDCDGGLIASTGDKAHCLNAGGMGRQDFETETLIAFSSKDHGADAGEMAPTLRAGGHSKSHANAGVPSAVAFTCSEMANSFAWERDIAPTIDAQVPNDSSNIQKGVRIGSAVRRLTPLECERLQGFPDGWTQIPLRNARGLLNGKWSKDGPRYKALGNSMAVPCMRWIGERIAAVEALAMKAKAACPKRVNPWPTGRKMRTTRHG